MKISTNLLFLVLVAVAAGCKTGSRDSVTQITLSELPRISWDSYKVDAYIEAAAKLQSLGQVGAGKELLALSRCSKELADGQRIVTLCRMLFTARSEHSFRRAHIGAAGFLADTDYETWPFEPIELIDGVPFAITTGYGLGGEPEPPESYVRYCISDCDWNVYRFIPKTEAQKRAALTKLLNSPKWKRSLENRDREFFESQIK